MERDSSVKRLDFEDVSLTFPGVQNGPAVTATSEGNDASEVSGVSRGSLLELPENCSIAELRQEAQSIRKSLASVDTFVNDFSQNGGFQQKVKAEAEAEQMSENQLKVTMHNVDISVETVVQKVFSVLESNLLDLTVKESILKRLAEWKIGDEENEDDSWLNNDSGTQPDSMGDELIALKNANAETILEIESLIRTIAKDVNGLETDLSNASGSLDAFDLQVDKLAEEEGRQDLEATIRHLEETLRQNEKEYEEAEAAMESRIEQYNLEIEELQAQASQLDREEECMRMLIDVTARFLQSQKHMEYSNDVSVVSLENGSIELRLTTYVPNIEDPKDEPDHGNEPMWEHNLHIKINQETMKIEEAKLAPESVPIDDLLSAAQETEVTTASIENLTEGELAGPQLAFLVRPQLAFLVRAVHQRLTIHAFKVASVSNASSDPRYCVEHTSGSPVVTVIKPGKLKALVEMPENWPMHGYSLRLQSLQWLDAQSAEAATDDTMRTAVEVANKMPEYIRHDLLTFVQAVERITSE